MVLAPVPCYWTGQTRSSRSGERPNGSRASPEVISPVPYSDLKGRMPTGWEWDYWRGAGWELFPAPGRYLHSIGYSRPSQPGRTPWRASEGPEQYYPEIGRASWRER